MTPATFGMLDLGLVSDVSKSREDVVEFVFVIRDMGAAYWADLAFSQNEHSASGSRQLCQLRRSEPSRPSRRSIELPARLSLLQEPHPDLRSIHPGHLTSPVRQSGRG
jgi:hypothetical protein